MALFPRDQGLLQRDLVSGGIFNLNTDWYFLGQNVCMEENNLKILLALYTSLEFRVLFNVKR